MANPSQHIQALQHWLDTATKGIGRLGRQRIEAEITAHYDEAHHSALDNGLSAFEAEASALKVLGDPDKARKKLSKKHLSQSEESTISYQLMRYRHPFNDSWAVLCLFIILPTLFYFMNGMSIPNSILFISAAISLYLGATIFWIKRRFAQDTVRYTMLSFCSIRLIWTTFLVSLLWYSISRFGLDFVTPIYLYLALYDLHGFFKGLKIYRKLPKQLSEEDVDILRNLNTKEPVA